VRKKNKGKGVKMKSADVNDDKVYTYARELLSYGLLPDHFFLSHRQLLWSRTVNTHGILGRNVPGDLFFEHLNKLCKSAVSDLCANKTPAAFERVGKCLGVFNNLSTEFDISLGRGGSRGSEAREGMTAPPWIT
jgi:hypothetical protein